MLIRPKMRILLLIKSANASIDETDIDIRYTALLNDAIYKPVYDEMKNHFKFRIFDDFRSEGEILAAPDVEAELLDELHARCGARQRYSPGLIIGFEDGGEKLSLQLMEEVLACMLANENFEYGTDSGENMGKIAMENMPYSDLIYDAWHNHDKNRLDYDDKRLIHDSLLRESIQQTIRLLEGNTDVHVYGADAFSGLCADDDCTKLKTRLCDSFPGVRGWFERNKGYLMYLDRDVHGDSRPLHSAFLLASLLVFGVMFPFHAYAADTSIFTEYTKGMRDRWAPNVDFSVDGSQVKYPHNVFKNTPQRLGADVQDLGTGDVIVRTRTAVSNYKGADIIFTRALVKAAAITRKFPNAFENTMFSQRPSVLYRGLKLTGETVKEMFPDNIQEAQPEYFLHGTSCTTDSRVAAFFCELDHEGRQAVRTFTDLSEQRSLGVSFSRLNPFDFNEKEMFVMPGVVGHKVKYNFWRFAATSDHDDSRELQQYDSVRCKEMEDQKRSISVPGIGAYRDDIYGAPGGGPKPTDQLTVEMFSEVHAVVERFLDMLDNLHGEGEFAFSDEEIKEMVNAAKKSLFETAFAIAKIERTRTPTDSPGYHVAEPGKREFEEMKKLLLNLRENTRKAWAAVQIAEHFDPQNPTDSDLHTENSAKVGVILKDLVQLKTIFPALLKATTKAIHSYVDGKDRIISVEGGDPFADKEILVADLLKTESESEDRAEEILGCIRNRFRSDIEVRLHEEDPGRRAAGGFLAA